MTARDQAEALKSSDRKGQGARVQKTTRTARTRLRRCLNRHLICFRNRPFRPPSAIPLADDMLPACFLVVDIESFDEITEDVQVFVTGFADFLFDAFAFRIQRA
jgi:hypothetical protein